MGKKKNGGINTPAVPGELLTAIPPAVIPNVNLTGQHHGIINDPVNGPYMGIYGLGNLMELSTKAQNQLTGMLNQLGQPRANDYMMGKSVADRLYNEGSAQLNNQYGSTYKAMQEDMFRRGMQSSSSMLSGLKGLMNANAGALAKLRSSSDQAGLEHALNLSDKRDDSAEFYRQLINDMYRQVNEFPINSGMNMAIPQADLFNNSKTMNLNRLNDYYRITNQGISDYNRTQMRRGRTDWFGNALDAATTAANAGSVFMY